LPVAAKGCWSIETIAMGIVTEHCLLGLVIVALQPCLTIALAQAQNTDRKASRELRLSNQSGTEAAQTGNKDKSSTTSPDSRPRLLVQLGHSSPVFSVAISPDGRYVVSGDTDGNAWLWEIETGKQLRKFEVHSATGASVMILSVAISPDGHYLLTGDGGKAARLWDMETGKQMRQFDGHSARVTSVVFSPDGRYVATGSADKAVILCEVGTGNQVRSFEGRSEVSSIAFSPDGRLLVIGGTDNTAQLWDVETGKPVRQFDERSETVSSAVAVAISSNGRYLVTGRNDHTARLWDMETGKQLMNFVGHSSFISSAAISNDNRYILTGSGDNTARLWDVETGKQVRRLDGHSNPVLCVAISLDGRYAVTGSGDNTVRLWDTSTGSQIRQFDGYSSFVSSVTTSTNGRYVVTGSRDNAARLWDLRAGKQALQFKGISALISPDSRYLVTYSPDKTFRLWEIETGKQVQQVELPSWISSIAISTDGRYLATGSFDNMARLWDLKTGKQVQQFNGQVTSIAISPDNRYLATGTEDNMARIWDVESGKQLQQFYQTEGRSSFILSVAFSPDGRYLATAGYDNSGRSDGNTARSWDVQTGKQIWRFDGHSSSVRAITFSPDGRYVVTGGNDHTIRLLDAETGKQLRQFEGHSSSVNSVAVSSDGRFLLSASQDSTTRLWDISTGQELCQLIAFRDGTWVVVDPEGRFDTDNLEEIVGLHWIMPDSPMKPLPIEIFMRDYYEPRLLTRILNREQFKPVRLLSELNRVQPTVRIANIEQQKDRPDLATVTVEVSKASAEFRRNGERITRETGVYDVRLFRDGQLVGQIPHTESVIETIKNSNASNSERVLAWQQSTQVKLDNSGKRIIKFENIKLPRKAGVKEVEFSAYAFNEDRVKSATSRQAFAITQELSAVKGRAYLITVGVNAYEQADFDLSFAANDARRVQSILSNKLSKTGAYEEIVQVPLISDYEMRNGKRVLSEKTATKGNVKAVLDLLAGKKVAPELMKEIPSGDKLRQAGPEDLVLISFSSHGFADDRGNFYFVPYDTGLVTELGITDELMERCISSEELSLWLRDVDAGETVMIADACHSAATIEAEGFKPGPMGSRGLGQLAYDKGMRILTSTQADDVALESKLIKQGLLTYALTHDGIEAEQADFKPKDKVITLSEWLEYGVARVPSLYEEVKTGELQTFGRAADERALVVISTKQGARSLARKTSIQQPSLFDFSKKKRDVTLMSIEAK
jgi:WD40 repeat protein